MVNDMSSQFIARALNHKIAENIIIDAVSIDSRAIEKNSCFIAIKGERFDGHDYVVDAVRAGATCVIVERAFDGLGVVQFIVNDTLEALQQLAHAWRKELNATVFGITGSNGKTSVKEMVRAALGDNAVHATSGNFNNLIGLPLTILAAPKNTEYLVLEMGMSIPGEMQKLSCIAEPDIVAITNASVAHAEGVGGIEGVRVEKAAIMQGLRDQGKVVLNRDDAAFAMWNEIAGTHEVVTFGRDTDSDFSLMTENEHYCVKYADNVHLFQNEFKGQHNYLNALCAIALVKSVTQMNVAEITHNLEQYQQVKGRLNFISVGDITLIDDSYNANPASAKAGVDVLVGENGLHILVLGTMAELGANAQALHEDVFAYAKEKEVEVIYGYGDLAAMAAQHHGGEGYTDTGELINAVLDKLTEKVVVLIKGSRSMRMERVVQALQTAILQGDAAC